MTPDHEYQRQLQSKAALIADLESLGASKNVADYWEVKAKEFWNSPFINCVNTGDQLTYGHADQIMTTLAAWGLQFDPKSVVCFISKNSVLYPCITIGMAKCGLTTSLINVNLKGAFLRHAVEIAKPVCCLVEYDMEQVFKDAFSDGCPDYVVVSDDRIKSKLKWFEEQLVDPALFKQRRSNISDRDPFVYIYTSGTTGPSKAAKFSHRRFIGCGVTWKMPSELVPGGSYYITLPLYHGNAGAIALSSVIISGLRAVIRERFSVSKFWSDIVEYGCRWMIYVGELWRYLVTVEAPPNHPLKVVVGNGLRPQVWVKLYNIGIERVVEHYGSTEMPGDALLNFMNKVGSCGYVDPAMKSTHGGLLIQFQGNPIRSADGLCVEVEPGQVGELVMPLVDGVYDGYVDPEQTQKKLYSSVLVKDDVWFSTGDLLKVEEGFYYFIDRTGDSFRWKGENVSASEIESTLISFDGLTEANIVAVKVPDQEGKCGMLIASGQFSVEMLSKFVQAQLPDYAVPIFVRILPDKVDMTSTFKFRKAAYAEDGFDLNRVQDKVYIWNKTNHQYELFTPEIKIQVRQGHYKF